MNNASGQEAQRRTQGVPSKQERVFLYCMGVQALAQVAQRGYGVYLLADLQKPHSLGETPRWSRGRAWRACHHSWHHAFAWLPLPVSSATALGPLLLQGSSGLNQGAWAWPWSLRASFPSLEHHGAWPWDLFPPLCGLWAQCPALNSAERGCTFAGAVGPEEKASHRAEPSASLDPLCLASAAMGSFGKLGCISHCQHFPSQGFPMCPFASFLPLYSGLGLLRSSKPPCSGTPPPG